MENLSVCVCGKRRKKGENTTNWLRHVDACKRKLKLKKASASMDNFLLPKRRKPSEGKYLYYEPTTLMLFMPRYALLKK